ncbi:hypothetical protein [Tahibacter sp.]|uniref:hypothetical protein n=1 Tax=Tahibacter sp. TaxID=2056211 RepID=UPI0028C4A839|nr:hypothetical protein [Tahibacter sp.]
MGHSYELRISQLDPLWRVAARDGGVRMPDYCRNYPSQNEATDYARGRAMQLLAHGDPVRVVLVSDGKETVVWNSSAVF